MKGGFNITDSRDHLDFLFSGFSCRFSGVELIIAALLLYELVVASAFDYPALLQNHYAVGVANSGQSVGDNECSSAAHQLIHSVLHQRFGTGINGGRGFWLIIRIQ